MRGVLVRKVSDWMKIYGFREGSDPAVAEAFVRNLSKAVYSSQLPPRSKSAPQTRASDQWIQLEFEFMSQRKRAS